MSALPRTFASTATPVPPDFRVLGVDTSVRNTGLAVVSQTGNRVESLFHATVHVPSNRPLTVCLLIANRVTGKFLSNYHDRMEELCRTVLDRI